MRLSVVAISLILLFSQGTLAQHSSGGGGSSGGGTSSGGSSSASSGAGSHGGGGSVGGSAHVSTSSHVASGFVHAPGKIDNLHATGSGPADEQPFYSSVRGESSEVHNQLLDQALAKLQYALPSNIKNDQPISAKSLKRIEPLDQKAERKTEVKKEESDRKHCHGHHCQPKLLTEYCAPGSNWRMSQELYNTLQSDCGHLAAKLQQEENGVAALQTSQQIACVGSPVGAECSSATGVLNNLNAKIAQLHDRYDQCILHDLHHNAAVYVSQK